MLDNASVEPMIREHSALGENASRAEPLGRKKARAAADLGCGARGCCALLVSSARSSFISPRLRSCHDRAGFLPRQASAHAGDADCQSCHLPAGLLGGPHWSFSDRCTRTSAPRRATVMPRPFPTPAASHVTEDARRVSITANGIRIDHASCATALVHRLPLRRRHTVRDGVGSLVRHGHAASSATSTSGNVACDLCHGGRERSGARQVRQFAVTHGRKWRPRTGWVTAPRAPCATPEDCARCHGAGVPHERSSSTSTRSTRSKRFGEVLVVPRRRVLQRLPRHRDAAPRQLHQAARDRGKGAARPVRALP